MQKLYSSVLRRFISCALIGCLAPAAGCSSMKTIHPVTNPSQPLYGPLKAGDTVIVQTRSGERARFVVQEVAGDVIAAPGGRRYGPEDLVRVQRKSFSGLKTACLVGGVVGGVVVMLGLAIAAAYDDLLSGGL